MNWRTEWIALSARIRGVTDATQLYYHARSGRTSDEYSTIKQSLLPRTRSIYLAIEVFANTLDDRLPIAAVECIKQFLSTRRDVFTNSDVLTDGAILFQITALAAFRSEFEYHISDLAAFARRQSERAFVHLQRSIVVDEDEQRKWREAFQKGETACEKLGAVRLLSHGIWAFKVDAVGERTDLVFQEPLGNKIDEMDRSADALVLTEWKICKNNSDLVGKLTEAKSQARRYRAGALAGVELTSYRYLVIVSSKHLTLPVDEQEDGVTYRLVNIAVSPNTPSVDSRSPAV